MINEGVPRACSPMMPAKTRRQPAHCISLRLLSAPSPPPRRRRTPPAAAAAVSNDNMHNDKERRNC